MRVNPEAFVAANGFHPGQCYTGNGVLQYERDTIMNYVRAGDAAGFTFHIHAIGDRAVKTALDAIEAAEAANGSSAHHIVTHLQVVQPEDISRFADLGVYASLTFAWAVIDPYYDHDGLSLHRPRRRAGRHLRSERLLLEPGLSGGIDPQSGRHDHCGLRRAGRHERPAPLHQYRSGGLALDRRPSAAQCERRAVDL
ncbi:MAG: amidohydrolase family protein [Parvularculaceae bacterium]